MVTNVVNDDNGIKNSQDFRLHILNGSALPSTFTGSPSPNGQIVAVEEGPYTVGVSNTDGYDVDFQYDCSGFIDERDIKVCSVNLDDISSDSPGTGSGGNGTDTGTGSGGNGTDTGTGSGGNGTEPALDQVEMVLTPALDQVEMVLTPALDQVEMVLTPALDQVMKRQHLMILISLPQVIGDVIPTQEEQLLQYYQHLLKLF